MLGNTKTSTGNKSVGEVQSRSGYRQEFINRSEVSQENVYPIALGLMGGLKGGKARTLKSSLQKGGQRSAKEAAKKRWGRKKDK